MYKMECNTCHCINKNSLVCTKMGCLARDTVKLLALQVKRAVPNTGVPDFNQDSCIPGMFYKTGCKKCFCLDSKKLICSKRNNCKDVNNYPSSPAALRSFNSEEFHQLPTLPHQAAACKAGTTYRVDCNTCFCLANGNLVCEKLLCPSYDDVNRLNAKNMSGTPCTKGDKLEAHCIQCTCRDRVMKCAAEPGCVPPEGRRQLHGPYPGNKFRDRFDPVKENCQEGMVYRTNCNKCYCQKDRSARCTQKTCLNYSQVLRLKKLRLQLEKKGAF